MPVSPRNQRGYTLIEGLIAVAIVAILLGLLLPAVQKVRGAAARVACASHLKQVALAFHLHHNNVGRLPYGGWQVYPAYAPAIGDPFATTPAARRASWGWAYQLLPHLGCEALYREPDPTLVRGEPVKVYYCPARRRAKAYDSLAKIDYAANAGTDAGGADGAVMKTPLGAIGWDDVTDGTSVTVLAAEKKLNRAELGASKDDDESYCTAGWRGDWQVYRLGTSPPRADVTLPGDPDGPRSAFGSAHPNGLNVAFCDGSVRYLSYKVNPTTWTRACVRNDSEVINPADL